MGISEKKKSYSEYIEYIKNSIGFAYKPNRLLAYSLKLQLSQVIVNSLILIFMLSTAIILLLVVLNSPYSIERQIKISVFVILESLVYLPSVFVSIIFKIKNIKLTLKASFYLCINVVVFYLSVPLIILLLFYKFENYFFYYASYFISVLITIFCIIILPIIINKGKYKFICAISSIIISVLFSISLNYVFNLNSNKVLSSMDPIIDELNTKEIIKNSNFDYLLSSGDIIISSINKYLPKKDIDYIKNIGLEEKPLLLLKEQLLEINKKIIFRTNRTLITTSINAIDILNKIIAQVSRISILNDELPQALKKAELYLKNSKLIIEKNSKIIEENMKIITKNIDRLTYHSSEITKSEYDNMIKEAKVLNNDIVTLNNDIKNINTLTEKINKELENSDKYNEFLEKLNSIIDEIIKLEGDYNSIIQERTKSIDKINKIYKVKKVFYFLP